MATRRNVAAPNLIVAPRQYDPRYQEQLNNVNRLFYIAVTNAVNAPYPYGNFYTTPDSTGTLTNSGVNAVNKVPFSVTSAAFNTTLDGNKTRVYVAETGVYNVQFSAQCDLSSGSNGDIYFWIMQNGVDVPASAGKVVVASPNAETMAAWNYVLVLKEKDYIELAWSSSDIHAQLLAENASTSSPVRPAIPAVILTITWVSPYSSSVGVS